MGFFDSIFSRESKKLVEAPPASRGLINLNGKFPFPIVSVPGSDVEAELRRLRINRGSKSVSPVVIGDFESATRLVEVWDDPFDFEQQLKLAAEINVERWFEERREEDAECYASEGQDVIHEAGTAPMATLTIGHDHSGMPRVEVYLALIPTTDATTIPLHLRFGDWNACPSPCEHVAVARYWRDKYGAEIATVASDVLEFTVADPPSDDDKAMELAWQQYVYCSDIVDQGVGSVATLAKALRHSSRWYFWWD